MVPIGGGALLITLILLLEWWAFTYILKRFHVGEMAFYMPCCLSCWSGGLIAVRGIIWLLSYRW